VSQSRESAPSADGVAASGDERAVESYPEQASRPSDGARPDPPFLPRLAPQRHAAVWKALPQGQTATVPIPVPDPRGAYAWVLPRRLLFFLEALATAVAGLVAWEVLVDWTLLDASLVEGSLASHSLLLALIGVVMFVGLWLDGAFSSRRRISGIDDGLLVVKHLIIALVSTAALAFVTDGFGTGFTAYSPRVVVAYVALVVVLIACAGAATYTWQRRMFQRGEGVRRLVIAGCGASAAEFERFLLKRRWLGVRCAGLVPVLDGPTESQRLGGLVLVAPVIGAPHDLVRVVRASGAGEVVVALDEDERAAFPGLARRLVAADIPFRVLPAFFEEGYAYACEAGLNGLPTVALHVESLDRVQGAVKRVLDVVLSLGVLIVTSPVLLIVALLVRLTSPGPVFFPQERVGRDGCRFVMYKFRSMYDNAEARLGGLMARNEADGARFKMKHDPRVTPLGRFIRRWSIDELPQFWNVLRGDMSIVGPRPPLPREVRLYETPQLARLKGKPGITGLWQVSGRSDLTFAQMVELDRSYLERWSLSLDLSIMLRTALAIVRRRGAY